MNNNVVIGAILPHPPIVIPFIGKEAVEKAGRSIEALKQFAKKLKSLEKDIDVLVVITPHGAVSDAAVQVYAGHVFEGNFASFGAAKPNFQLKGCPELASALVKQAESYSARSPETILDHGILVPLYYPLQEKINLPILPIAIAFLPLKKLFEFGKNIQETARQLNKRIAVIASADLSHRLTKEAPAGFDPAGKVFDQKLVDLVRKYDVNEILNFPETLAEAAGQDALWSIAILLGALDGLEIKPEILSYEGPFGVGYMIAQFEPLARGSS